MEDILKCSICLDVLNDPRTLKCMHSFCLKCLHNYVEEQRAGQEVNKSIFNCPDCRTEFEVKEGGKVETIRPNHFVNNILEIFKLQQQPEGLACTLCGSCAVSRCLACEKQLCKKCLTTHNDWGDFKDHKTITIKELSVMNPEDISLLVPKRCCTKHKDEKLTLYCETCHKLVCIQCVVLDQHTKPNHLCKPIEEIVEEKKEKLRKVIVILEEQFKTSNEAMNGIEKTMNVLEKNKEKTINDIKVRKEAVIKELKQKVEEKADRLIEFAEKKFDDISKPLKHQNDQIGFHAKQVKGSLETAKKLLQGGNGGDIASLQNEIQENVETTTQQIPQNTTPIHSGMMKFQSTAIIFEGVLNKLGDVVCDPVKEPVKEVAVKVLKNVCDAKNHPELHADVNVEEKIKKLCETSAILSGQQDYVRKMITWVDENFQWRVCYQATKDGWQARKFHKKCDKKAATLILIKVKQYIVGGYTDQDWAGKEAKMSDKTFLFSLQNKDNLPPFKCYCKDQSQWAIICDPHFGPIFGSGDLVISNKADNNNESYTHLGYSYQLPPGYVYKTDQTEQLLCGSRHFTPCEIEVFY